MACRQNYATSPHPMTNITLGQNITNNARHPPKSLDCVNKCLSTNIRFENQSNLLLGMQNWFTCDFGDHLHKSKSLSETHPQGFNLTVCPLIYLSVRQRSYLVKLVIINTQLYTLKYLSLVQANLYKKNFLCDKKVKS